MSERFQKVDEQVSMWSPRLKGKKGDAENPLTELAPGPNSWITGWYLGFRKFTAKESGDEYTVHKMKAYEIGDASMTDAEITKEGVNIEFFGSGVLNRIIAENIAEGQPIRVMWKGVVPKSDKVKRPYHIWDVDVDTEAEPINVMNGIIVGDAQSSNNDIPQTENAPVDAPKTEGAPANSAEEFVAEGDDDLPF